MLEVKDLVTAYGPVVALDGVSLSATPGKVTAVLGANGAGKTSLLRTISGLVRPKAGSVHLDGEDVTRAPVEKMVHKGMAHVPEGRGVIAELTIEENLRLGAYVRKDGAQVRADIKRCYGSFPRLEERRTQAAGSLSGGEQQMLAIARGLMLRPRLMLLDEPSHGLSPLITREVFKILREIVEEGTTLLIVEQNANLVLEFADHAYVLETGRLTFEGAARDLLADKRIREAYLGI